MITAFANAWHAAWRTFAFAGRLGAALPPDRIGPYARALRLMIAQCI